MSITIPFGRVVLDATPVELPTRLSMPVSRADQIREFIRHEVSMQASVQGHESFEEADDFSLDEDQPLTPYELAMLDGEIQPIVDRILADRAAGDKAASAASATPPVAESVESEAGSS